MGLIGTAGVIYISNISKNMIVVLGGALLIYYLIITIAYSFGLLKSKNGTKKEGMENNDDSNKKAELKKNEDLKKTIKKINQNAPTSSQGLVMTPIQQTDSVISNTSESSVNSGDESFEVGRSKKNSQGYNIDYASTVEDAYDELNKILGSDGIKRLTSDTQNLMKQQLQLAESMKSMQPLIAGMAPIMEQAKGLLGNIGDTGNLGNLSKIEIKFLLSCVKLTFIFPVIMLQKIHSSSILITKQTSIKILFQYLPINFFLFHISRKDTLKERFLFRNTINRST
jgi:hypothetical protein